MILSRKILVVVSIAIWAVYAVNAWWSTANLFSLYKDRPFGSNFAPGLVETVETIRGLEVMQVSGPHHDLSPYVFHRFNEMLYPIMYLTPLQADSLDAGKLYVLLPGQEPPVAAKCISESGLFRLMEVQP